jgi:hypothetical protein
MGLLGKLKELFGSGDGDAGAEDAKTPAIDAPYSDHQEHAKPPSMAGADAAGAGFPSGVR